MQKDGLLIVPIFNEKNSWEKILYQIDKFAINEDLLLIDDGNQPSLPPPSIKRLTILRHLDNKGYGKSIWEGIRTQ